MKIQDIDKPFTWEEFAEMEDTTDLEIKNVWTSVELQELIDSFIAAAGTGAMTESLDNPKLAIIMAAAVQSIDNKHMKEAIDGAFRLSMLILITEKYADNVKVRNLISACALGKLSGAESLGSLNDN